MHMGFLEGKKISLFYSTLFYLEAHGTRKKKMLIMPKYHLYKRCEPVVPVAVMQPGYPGVVGLMKPKQEQMASSYHH